KTDASTAPSSPPPSSSSSPSASPGTTRSTWATPSPTPNGSSGCCWGIGGFRSVAGQGGENVHHRVGARAFGRGELAHASRTRGTGKQEATAARFIEPQLPAGVLVRLGWLCPPGELGTGQQAEQHLPQL